MANNTMNNIVITARNNTAVVFRQNDIAKCRYTKVVKKDAGTAMASLYAIAQVLESIDENRKDCTTIIIPKFLGLMLKINAPAEIRANGYKTQYGKELSREYVDMMCYINELRSYLTTRVVRFLIEGSTRLTREQTMLIGKCWDVTDTIVKPANKEVRMDQKITRPVRPACMA